MKLSVIMPVRGRTQQVLRAIDAWSQQGVELLIGADWQDRDEYRSNGVLSAGLIYFYGPRIDVPILRLPKDHSKFLTAVNKQNWLAEKATGDWIFMAASDFLPTGRTWHSQLMAYLAACDLMPILPGVIGLQGLVVNLEHPGRHLVCHPIMNRKYYETQGYFVNPEYIHVCSDSEQFLAAKYRNALVQAPDEIVGLFEHKHPYFQPATGWDDIYAIGNDEKMYAQGNEVFARNKGKWYI
jgi:hypothetical protein